MALDIKITSSCIKDLQTGDEVTFAVVGDGYHGEIVAALRKFDIDGSWEDPKEFTHMLELLEAAKYDLFEMAKILTKYDYAIYLI